MSRFSFGLSLALNVGDLIVSPWFCCCISVSCGLLGVAGAVVAAVSHQVEGGDDHVVGQHVASGNQTSAEMIDFMQQLFYIMQQLGDGMEIVIVISFKVDNGAERKKIKEWE